jgi:putative RNA 2'-phosphotransferase
MTTSQKKLSKTLAVALRHHPRRFGLTLDAEGWVSLETLLAALRHSADWRYVTAEDLARLIEESDKPRYEIAGDKIRARYGHSLPTKIPQTLAEPPEILYHGTKRSAVKDILKDGLLPMSRQYVHLSEDEATALTVGERHPGEVALLWIMAGEAYRNGGVFYFSSGTIWLADFVAPQYIRLNPEND